MPGRNGGHTAEPRRLAPAPRRRDSTQSSATGASTASHRTPARTLRVATATALVAVSLLVTGEVAATPPGLTGEFLASGSTSQKTAAASSRPQCSQVSASTIAFTATGTSTNPYPGTFTESGVVTVLTMAAGQIVNGVPLYKVTALDAFFTINSAAGDVTGSKHMTGTDVYALRETYDAQLLGSTGSTVTGYFREVVPDNGFGLAYDAIIVTPDGAFLDTGRSGLLLSDLNLSDVSPAGSIAPSNAFNAAFWSDGVMPVSVVGDATGGGQVKPDGRTVSFGFEARSRNGL
jgi:hypothetical protein